MPNYSRDLTERQQLSAAAQDVSLKRTRRTEEPTYKAADDAALDAPWRDLEGISQPVLFALSEVFHFSHTTEVQRVAVPRLIKDGQHGVIEAPTGSGKTLSFLVPLLERQLRHTAAFFKAHKRPLLTRRIVGCVLSPSRVLAQQTYVVARSLGCRSLQEVRFELCDTVVTKVGGIVAHLRKVARNGGVVLVGTPSDFETVWRALDGEAAVGDSSDDEEPEEVPVVEEEEEDAAQRKAALAARRRRDEGRSHGPQPGTSSEAEPCRVVANDGHPFAFVVDEADVVLKSPKMRNSIHRLIDRYRAAHGEEAPLDMVLCGATVGSAPEVPRLLQHARVPPARLARVVVGTTEHFIQQLDNRYIVTSSEDMLGMLVHLINTHPTKKHLIFFNSASVLCYVRAALEGLTDHKRPLLHIPALFSLHEQQRDSVKFREFGRFVKYSAKDAAAAMVRKFQQAQRHGTCLTASGTAAPAALGATQHRRKGTVNTEATIVAKGKQQAVPGAVLLCTDVAAFGLDIRDVDYVYHFEVPATTRAYIHRIGRVARMGMRGSSVILVPALEEGGASAVQQAYLKELTEAHSLNACACPSMAATITPAIRNSVQRDPKLAGLLGEAAQDMAAKAPWLSPAEAAAFLCGVAA